MSEKLIAYEGREFIIEWYCDERGKIPALEYFNGLPVERKKKVFYLFKTMANQGEILNTEKFRNEGDQIYAFKPSPDRFLCFFVKDSKIVVTNAFHKKSRKLPLSEKSKALRYRENYLERVKQGKYYG